MLTRKCFAFGSALQLDESAFAIHHHIHIGITLRILSVVQIEHRLALVDADRNRGDLAGDRIIGDQAFALAVRDSIAQSHIGAGDGGGAGAAVGLYDIAVKGDGALTEFLAVNAAAQGAAD